MISATVNDVSVQEFLQVTKADVATGMTKDVLREAAERDSAELSGWMRAVALQGTQQALGERVVGLLQDDAAGMFAGAWNLCAELKQTAQETREHPGQASVTLTEHEFSYKMSPRVEVRVDSARLGSFDFELELSCKVSALELQLEKGCVTGLSAGTCDGRASLSLAGQEIWQRDLVHVNLPGALRLSRPIPL